MIVNHLSFRATVISLLVGFCGLTFMPSAYAASSDEWRCKSYARDAVEQNAKNLSVGCGFTGLRWNNDRAGQQQWCLTVRKAITAKEDRVRKKMLSSCYANKSARNNPENQPNIPWACNDPSGNYLPVRSLFSWYRYERNLHTPVGKNGLIQRDYNADGKRDYVFIEHNANDDVRLTTCFSSGKNSYQRQLTDVAFNANLDSLSSEQYFISAKNNALHFEINYFGHNEGGCSSRGNYSYNKKRQRFEITTSDANCSPVIDAEGQPYPMSPPTLPKMH